VSGKNPSLQKSGYGKLLLASSFAAPFNALIIQRRFDGSISLQYFDPATDSGGPDSALVPGSR
jgi:hypothetical protein